MLSHRISTHEDERALHVRITCHKPHGEISIESIRLRPKGQGTLDMGACDLGLGLGRWALTWPECCCPRRSALAVSPHEL